MFDQNLYFVVVFWKTTCSKCR